MTEKKTIPVICCLLVMLGTPASGYGQFINFELEVESELSARVEQALDFGMMVRGEGRKVVNLGDISMGIFSISTYSNQTLLLDIEKPDFLRNADPSVPGQVPISLFINYSIGANSTADRSVPVRNNSVQIALPGTSDGIWEKIFIYMYGNIDVGDVAEGNYIGDVILSVKYL